MAKAAPLKVAWVKFEPPAFPTYWQRMDINGSAVLSLVAGADGTIASATARDVKIASQNSGDLPSATSALQQSVDAVRAGWRIASTTRAGTAFTRTVRYGLEPAASPSTSGNDKFTVSCDVTQFKRRKIARPDLDPQLRTQEASEEKFSVEISFDLSKNMFSWNGKGFFNRLMPLVSISDEQLVLYNERFASDHSFKVSIGREDGLLVSDEQFMDTNVSMIGGCAKVAFKPLAAPPARRF